MEVEREKIKSTDSQYKRKHEARVNVVVVVVVQNVIPMM